MPNYTNYVWDKESRAWINLGGSVSAKIYYDTKENWNSQTSFISEHHAIYVYTNYKEIEDEVGNKTYVPGIKIGDGKAYLIDLPFVGDITDVETNLEQHIQNLSMHITEEERLFWNNKCNAPHISGENLLFTTNK